MNVIPTLIFATESSASGYASIDVSLTAWIVLTVSIVALLLLDLLLVHRTPHDITLREALIESGVWIALGLSFGLVVLHFYGGQAAGEYYAGYLIEKSLSIDNVFVWAVILTFFAVPNKYQFRVLFWGVFGALVLRAIFIFAGVALITRFDWLLVVFGVFLLYSAWRLVSGSEEVDPSDNPVLKLVRQVIPSTTEYHGQRLFVRVDHKLLATPLFAVLVLIEATDVIFAVDSVPAILAVSHEPFLVFSSNAFAIMGLRALYFALAGLKDRFRYLDYGLAAILGFVALKMIGTYFGVHIPIPVSLAVIFGLLAVSIVASLLAPPSEHPDDVPGGFVDDVAEPDEDDVVFDEAE